MERKQQQQNMLTLIIVEILFARHQEVQKLWSLTHVNGIAWKPEFGLEFGLELTWLARSCLSNYYFFYLFVYFLN